MAKTYHRVIPRDLFNEAKLLKCLGQLCLLVEDGMAGNLTYGHYNLGENHNRFMIEQAQENDGSFFVNNLAFRAGKIRLAMSTPLNSREPYPLYATQRDGAKEEVAVFTDDGKLTPAFKEWVGLETGTLP